MAFSIARYVPELLQENPERKFTAREIARWIMQKYPAECDEKMRRSRATVIPIDSPEALQQQIVAEIGAQRKSIQKRNPNIKTTEGRPRKFYFTTKTDTDEAMEPVSNTPVPSGADAVVPQGTLTEADLYPLLAEYLGAELSVHSKRIDEKRSRNARGRGGNRWLYPDLVGMEDLSASWHAEVRDCAKEYFDKKTKLWSFEVKLLINGSNVREAYFQAVSNSSWANFGYLVAAEIEGPDTLRELRMLSGLHGVGVIRLDCENISESQIMIPSRERQDVDWQTANRLAEENSDFIDYIRLVRQFYQTGDPRSKDWDFQMRSH